MTSLFLCLQPARSPFAARACFFTDNLAVGDTSDRMARFARIHHARRIIRCIFIGITQTQLYFGHGQTRRTRPVQDICGILAFQADFLVNRRFARTARRTFAVIPPDMIFNTIAA